MTVELPDVAPGEVVAAIEAAALGLARSRQCAGVEVDFQTLAAEG